MPKILRTLKQEKRQFLRFLRAGILIKFHRLIWLHARSFLYVRQWQRENRRRRRWGGRGQPASMHAVPFPTSSSSLPENICVARESAWMSCWVFELQTLGLLTYTRRSTTFSPSQLKNCSSQINSHFFSARERKCERADWMSDVCVRRRMRERGFSFCLCALAIFFRCSSRRYKTSWSLISDESSSLNWNFSCAVHIYQSLIAAR